MSVTIFSLHNIYHTNIFSFDYLSLPLCYLFIIQDWFRLAFVILFGHEKDLNAMVSYTSTIAKQADIYLEGLVHTILRTLVLCSMQINPHWTHTMYDFLIVLHFLKTCFLFLVQKINFAKIKYIDRKFFCYMTNRIELIDCL